MDIEQSPHINVFAYPEPKVRDWILLSCRSMSCSVELTWLMSNVPPKVLFLSNLLTSSRKFGELCRRFLQLVERNCFSSNLHTLAPAGES